MSCFAFVLMLTCVSPLTHLVQLSQGTMRAHPGFWVCNRAERHWSLPLECGGL